MFGKHICMEKKQHTKQCMVTAVCVCQLVICLYVFSAMCKSFANTLFLKHSICIGMPKRDDIQNRLV